MEPINFEDDIRKKLQEREIAPSEGAWAKLDAQLATVQPQKKGFPWLAVAASFIGILIVASVWFSQTNSDAPSEIVVEDTAPPADENTPKILQQQPTIVEATENADLSQSEIAVQETQNQSTPSRQEISEVPQLLPKKREEATASKEAMAVKEVQKATITPNNKLELIMPKPSGQQLESQAVAQVVAQVKAMQKENGDVTSNNIEALLSQARQRLQTERLLSSRKIDPSALLEDVEADLEESFRNKVFDALGSGFEKIRTAVVERNN